MNLRWHPRRNARRGGRVIEYVAESDRRAARLGSPRYFALFLVVFIRCCERCASARAWTRAYCLDVVALIMLAAECSEWAVGQVLFSLPGFR